MIVALEIAEHVYQLLRDRSQQLNIPMFTIVEWCLVRVLMSTEEVEAMQREIADSLEEVGQ